MDIITRKIELTTTHQTVSWEDAARSTYNLTVTLDAETGAVVVTEADVVVALGVFDMEDWELGEELGPFSYSHYDAEGHETIWGEIYAILHAALEDEDPCPTWGGPDDYSDDAAALASAGFGTDEDYGGGCMAL